MFKQELLLLTYNKDVICVIDKESNTICRTTPQARRQLPDGLPLYDPYIPRKEPAFFNCTKVECKPLPLHSLTQITPLKHTLKSCFFELTYQCETLRYHKMKDIDKLQFFSDNIPDKKFYLADCLVYGDGSEVCHRSDINDEKHDKLINLGVIVRPNETNILSQDELLCEESIDKEVNCDLNILTSSALLTATHRDLVPKKENVLLKTDTFLVQLKYNCFEEWCGYSGKIPVTSKVRRNYMPLYDTPGGKMFRCYYIDSQQICKHIDLDLISAYNINSLK